MRRIEILFVLLFTSSVLSGQVGYFATDSSIKYNVEIVDQGDKSNSQNVLINNHGRLLEFSPHEIQEYGYGDGRVYFSREFEPGNKIFMERLVKGNTSLYYYKEKGVKKFYLERDSASLIELRKRDEHGKKAYKTDLSDYTSDFPALKENTKLLSYNKISISNFISRYNQNSKKPIPFFKYGIIIGGEWMKMIPSGKQYEDFLRALDYEYEWGLTVGIFFDRPLKASDFSLHMEMTFSSHDFAYQTLEDRDLSYTANLSSVRIPLLVRYTSPKENEIRPYVSAGVVYQNNFRIEDELISTAKMTSITYNDYIFTNNFGCSVGCGLDIKLTTRNYLFVELRLNRTIGRIHSDFGKLSNRDLSLSTGFNF